MDRRSVTRAALALPVAALLAGCLPSDFAAEKVAEAAARYCGLSETGRQLVAEKVQPYLAPGVEVDIRCPRTVASR